jgi:hypothetical protein
LSVFHEITKDFTACGVSHHGPRRNLETYVLAAGSGFVRATPMLSATRTDLAPVMEVEKGIQTFLNKQDYIAAAPAVAAVGPPARHKLLAPERNAAVSSVTRADRDPY